MTSEVVHVVKLFLSAFRVATPNGLITSRGSLSAGQVRVVKLVVEYRQTAILKRSRPIRQLLIANAV